MGTSPEPLYAHELTIIGVEYLEPSDGYDGFLPRLFEAGLGPHTVAVDEVSMLQIMETMEEPPHLLVLEAGSNPQQALACLITLKNEESRWRDVPVAIFGAQEAELFMQAGAAGVMTRDEKYEIDEIETFLSGVMGESFLIDTDYDPAEDNKEMGLVLPVDHDSGFDELTEFQIGALQVNLMKLSVRLSNTAEFEDHLRDGALQRDIRRFSLAGEIEKRGHYNLSKVVSTLLSRVSEEIPDRSIGDADELSDYLAQILEQAGEERDGAVALILSHCVGDEFGNINKQADRSILNLYEASIFEAVLLSFEIESGVYKRVKTLDIASGREAYELVKGKPLLDDDHVVTPKDEIRISQETSERLAEAAELMKQRRPSNAAEFIEILKEVTTEETADLILGSACRAVRLAQRCAHDTDIYDEARVEEAMNALRQRMSDPLLGPKSKGLIFAVRELLRPGLNSLIIQEATKMMQGGFHGHAGLPVRNALWACSLAFDGACPIMEFVRENKPEVVDPPAEDLRFG